MSWLLRVGLVTLVLTAAWASSARGETAQDGAHGALLYGDAKDPHALNPAPIPWPTWSAQGKSSPAAPSHVRWAMLRCSFPGSPAFELNTAQMRRVFEKPEAGVFAFFDRQSRGAMSQEISWAVDVTLPRSRADYWSTITSLSRFLDTTTTDCMAGAGRAFDGIDGLAVYYNADIDCCAYGSKFQMPLPGGETRQVQAMWLPPFAGERAIVIAHEMAHSLDIRHSNNTDGDWDTTDNVWDLMSNITFNVQQDEEIGTLPRGFHPYHRHLLGWLDESEETRVEVATGPDRTETVVLGPDSLLVLDYDGTEGLTVSFRGTGHADEGTRAVPAVFIDELHTWRPQPLWVVDTALPIPNIAATDTSYFTAGESWVVEEATPGRALMVEVVSVSPSGATVRVHLGPPPPPVLIWMNGFESVEVSHE